MSTEAKWEAAKAPSPIYRDGLSTDLSYAILATKKESEGYEVVCYRRGVGKIKFYPNLEAWSLTLGELQAMGFYSSLDRTGGAGYFRMCGNTDSVKKLLDKLATTRNVAAVPSSMLEEGLSAPRDTAFSLEVHPYRTGTIPNTPRPVKAVPAMAVAEPVQETVKVGTRKKPLKD